MDLCPALFNELKTCLILIFFDKQTLKLQRLRLKSSQSVSESAQPLYSREIASGLC